MLLNPTRILFFTGKGGVGKTSVACATAVHLADSGKRVLIVSTDPASNLDEVFGVSLSPEPRPVIPNLWACNLDPVAAAAQRREQLVGPYRGILPAAAIRSMEEQLSGACTVEIAAFDAFSSLLGDANATTTYDHVIFDTAPTGHTLRLLELPTAWSDFLHQNSGNASCLGPLAGLQAQRHLYAATRNALADGTQTTLLLVARPETSALREAERSRAELADLGILNQHLLINGIFKAESKDPIALAIQQRGERALQGMPKGLASLPRLEVPLLGRAPMGVEGLRHLGRRTPDMATAEDRPIGPLPPPLSGLLPELTASGHGVILTMGKGGVGKTTVAAAIAVELARRGFPVLLSTTDPAAHVAETVGTTLPNLRIGRIDPAAETAAYQAEVMASAGAALDEAGRALLAEDLRSPCTEEIAVFRAFARVVAEGQQGFVVLDTAPTGHTLLLLDASEAYHREVLRTTSQMPDAVRNLLPRLRDPAWTRVLLVTLPEATPVHEAAMLGKELERAGIQPFGWVVNASLSPLSLEDPRLRLRQQQEGPFIAEVLRLASRTALLPYQVEVPTGPEALGALFRPVTAS